MAKTKYLVVFGTRPEAIKVAPVLRALEQDPQAECIACSTGQHKELLDSVLSLFRIKPHYELNVMLPNQQLCALTSRLLTELEKVIVAESPDRVLVQGDTTTAMAGAMAACYFKIPVGHIEAGVRSHNNLEPFPEEVNRKVIDVVSDLFFAPTNVERHDLIREGVAPEKIFVTGNTSIDALRLVSSQPFRMRGSVLQDLPFTTKRIILATVHRRENHGPALEQICEAIQFIARRYRHIAHIVIPVHPNPNVVSCVYRKLGEIENVSLLAPLGYREVVALAQKSYLAMTDSGGLSEEMTWLGVPTLILRNVTDRYQAVEAGAAKLVGVEANVIINAATELMENPVVYREMAQPRQIFGDGRAAELIAGILEAHHRSRPVCVEAKLEQSLIPVDANRAVDLPVVPIDPAPPYSRVDDEALPTP